MYVGLNASSAVGSDDDDDDVMMSVWSWTL